VDAQASSAAAPQPSGQPVDPSSPSPGPAASSKPRVLWAAYFNQLVRSVPGVLPANVVVPREEEFSLTLDTAFAEAERLFRLHFPGEEFVPEVPHPDDVVYGPGQEDAEAKEEKAPDASSSQN